MGLNKDNNNNNNNNNYYYYYYQQRLKRTTPNVQCCMIEHRLTNKVHKLEPYAKL
jgi:hypothetical protein